MTDDSRQGRRLQPFQSRFSGRKWEANAGLSQYIPGKLPKLDTQKEEDRRNEIGLLVQAGRYLSWQG